MKKIQHVSIIGMGALGLLYGNHIAEKAGMDAVDFVMDEARFEQKKGKTNLINGVEKQFLMTPDSQAKPADLLIVAVKSTGLEKALDTMKNCIDENTAIISVLNGISSEEMIAERYGHKNMIYTVAQAMDAMIFDNGLEYTRLGELRIGQIESGNPEQLNRVTTFFDEIELPYVVEKDILYRMWGKFMLNVGINQTCMVYNTNYRTALSEGEANRTLIAAMREVIAVANAEGIALSEADLNQYIEIISTLKPTGTPSMGQDRIHKRPSEVEMFSGTVIRLAQKHHLHVPTNRFLYNRVHEIESEYVTGTGK